MSEFPLQPPLLSGAAGNSDQVDASLGDVPQPPPEPDHAHDAPVSLHAQTGSRRHRRRLGDIGQPEESTRGWLVSFTDLMGVMLTFFVLMFSMVEPAAPAFEKLATSLNQSLGNSKPGSGARGPQDGPSIHRQRFVPALDTSYLTALLRAQAGDNPLLDDAMLSRQQNALVISLPERLVFAPGKSDVSYDGARALYVLADGLNHIRNRIEVVGHAAPVFAEGGLGADLWQLSLARAQAVAAILQKAGYSRDIAIYGDSSGGFEDLAGSDETRQKLARRVDIILRDDAN
jgi:chemotaxis protein MotB